MATLEKINAFLKAVNAAAWGPPLLFLLLGTGIFLTIQLRALPIRRLFFALRTAFGREARYSGEKTEAGVSPFASLMTELAAEHHVTKDHAVRTYEAEPAEQDFER